MSITEKFAASQIERFANFPFFPVVEISASGKAIAPLGLRDMIAALRDASRDEDHAKRICDRIVRTQTRRCPLPGEFYAAAEAMAEESRYNSVPSLTAQVKCKACSDMGFIVDRRTRNGEECDVAVECSCRKAMAHA